MLEMVLQKEHRCFIQMIQRNIHPVHFMLILQAHCYLLEEKFRTCVKNNKSTWLHIELVLESTHTQTAEEFLTLSIPILSINAEGIICDRHMKFTFSGQL
jgi:glycerol-3-phosphate responsive antiterminator